MTDEQFAELLALGHELPSVEFKGPGPLSNKQLLVKVIRTALGMANRRDGGRIVVGVAEDGLGNLQPAGLSPDDLASWRYDEVADALGGYAEPSIAFTIEVRRYEGREFVVLNVQEFDDIAILCSKDYPGVLRKGACYVRSRRKPETTEIPSQQDMRDLLDLATEKRLRKYLATARKAGLVIESAASPSDDERFNEQLGPLK